MTRSLFSRTNDDGQDKLGLDRLVFFSDAVFAIAITLLALEIRMPEFESRPSDYELGRQLLHLWPRYLGYVMSFLVIGSYWMAHHRLFRYVVRYTRGLLWLNLLFLMSIAAVPFFSGLLGEYGDRRSVVIAYAAVIAVAGLFSTAMWGYAHHNRRLLAADASEVDVRAVLLRAGVVPAVFLISIAVAFVNPRLAMFSWALLLLIRSVI